MADGAVRKAVRDYLRTANITGLQSVYLDVPWFIDGARWDVYDTNGWAAVAAVHLNSSMESRITMPWKDGSKQVNHTVAIILQYQYLIPSQFGYDESEDAWVTGLDSIIDGVKNAIRADYTLGAPDIIFQGGQNNGDIRIIRDVPVVDNGRVIAWNVLEFDVTEIIQA